MRKLLKYSFLLYLAFILSGCATVISGTHQYVQFENDETIEDSTSIVKEVRVKRKLVGPQFAVSTENPNHKKRVRKTFNEVSLLNFIVLPFWLVDILTGAIVKYKE